MSTQERSPRKIIPVHLDPELHQAVRELAREIGEGDATIMRLAIRAGLPTVKRMLGPLKGELEKAQITPYPPHRDAVAECRLNAATPGTPVPGIPAGALEEAAKVLEEVKREAARPAAGERGHSAPKTPPAKMDRKK